MATGSFLALAPPCARAEPFPASAAPLEWTEDPAVLMVDGIHRFLDKETELAAARRFEHWRSEFSPAFASERRKWLRDRLGLSRPVPPPTAVAGDLSARVIILDRRAVTSGVPGVREAKLPKREFLWRAFFELGFTLAGEEVRRVLAVIDNVKARAPERRIAVRGTGDAGLTALLAAAVDERVSAAGVRGYFGPRERQWSEPIDRTVFGLVRECGDAGLAALVAPRKLMVEPGGFTEWSAPPPPAAPGFLVPVAREAIVAEIDAARAIVPGDWLTLADNSAEVDRMLREAVGADGIIIEIEAADDPALYREWLDLTQELMRASPGRRQEFWKRADFAGAEAFVASAERYRDHYWNEVIGRLPAPDVPTNPRARVKREHPRFRTWEVALDVHQHVFAFGSLLVPTDLKPGEKRPVVVCQHGLEGRPDDLDNPAFDHPAYHSFGAKLAEQGFVVFAPQNPYIGKTHFRQVCRKAWPLGLSLWSFIASQHLRILEWLATLDFVDPSRIGFYGLSYGGKTAVRIPALLEGYALSICSADFNEWVWKNCDARAPWSYLYTAEYDMVEWSLGDSYNYAELSWLIFPRPFMVERGHDDTVSCDEWVAFEFARTWRHYNKLGRGDRAAIEFFAGPHTINGKGTFEFLHRHLGPVRASRPRKANE